MLNGLQIIRAAILLRSLVLIREKGDPKHKKGTQIPKKVPMGSPHWGPIVEQCIFCLCHCWLNLNCSNQFGIKEWDYTVTIIGPS